MQLTISNLFGEPRTSFNISYKVTRLIRQRLIEKIMVPYGIAAREPEYMLGLCVSTSKDCAETHIKGPDIDEENQFVSWGLWLPFAQISRAEDPVRVYIECFFDASAKVFVQYEVPESALRDVQRSVESEVVGNPVYEFEQDDTPWRMDDDLD